MAVLPSDMNSVFALTVVSSHRDDSHNKPGSLLLVLTVNTLSFVFHPWPLIPAIKPSDRASPTTACFQNPCFQPPTPIPPNGHVVIVTSLLRPRDWGFSLPTTALRAPTAQLRCRGSHNTPLAPPS